MTQHEENVMDHSDGRTIDSRDGDASVPPADSPLVSAIISTYNREKYIEEAVRSVLDQTYANIELIVVDDHSSTPVAGVLNLGADNRISIEIVRHSENRGANEARITGLERANGELVAFLDDDDWWEPDKIEKQVAAFDDSPDETGVVYTGQRLHTDSGIRFRKATAEGDLTKTFLLGNPIGGYSTVMIRREAIKEAGYPDENMSPIGDREWFLRLSENWLFKPVPEPLVNYRMDNDSGAPRLSSDLESRIDASFGGLAKKHESTARQFGWLFSRKMKGNLAFQIAYRAYFRNDYDTAKTYAIRAILFYPFRWEPYVALIVSLVGNRPLELLDCLPGTDVDRLVRSMKRAYFKFLR